KLKKRLDKINPVNKIDTLLDCRPTIASSNTREDIAPKRQPIGSSNSAGNHAGKLVISQLFHSSSVVSPPRLAPAVVPRIDGLASGFRKSPCTNTPATESAAPASTLFPSRHARKFKNTDRKAGSSRSPSPTH